MLCLKKVYRDELLQLALLLSLLRSDCYLNDDPIYSSSPGAINLGFDDNGTNWRSNSRQQVLITPQLVHPKSLDLMLLNYERDVFADLNSLGRYQRQTNIRQPDITAYLLNVASVSTVEQLQTNNNNADGASGTAPPAINTSMGNNSTGTSLADVSSSSSINRTELSQEDMDLIEVLWKQDVDLGVPLEISTAKTDKLDLSDNSTSGTASALFRLSLAATQEDNLEKLKALKEVNESGIKIEPEQDARSPSPEFDPWAGFNYTIDTETGEYVIKGELEDTLAGTDCGPSCDLPLGDLSLPLPEFLLEQALGLVGLDDVSGGGNGGDDDQLAEEGATTKDTIENEDDGGGGSALVRSSTPGAITSSSTTTSAGNEIDSEEELDILTDMIQTTQFHHPHHHRAFQSRMPFVRTMSMEQRWQDLANLLSLPSPGDAANASSMHPFSHHHHHHHHHAAALNYGLSAHSGHGMGGYGGAGGSEAARAAGVLLHNATLTPPMGEINPPPVYGGGTNLGNAVAASMNLTNSSEPMGGDSSSPHYKVEPSSSHENMMYYQHNGTSAEMNQTDGFLSSILNDEDLQLMDMAMNEGMYTMRMLDSSSSNNGSLTGAAAAVAVAAAPTTSSTSHHRVDVERMDTSSDSAVSSMGSERVASLSDGEWCDGGSDSGHTAADHYHAQTGAYQHTKYRPYDYSVQSSGSRHTQDRIPPVVVAQKKHQMFGKRYFQEQGVAAAAAAAAAASAATSPIKYEYSPAAGGGYHTEGGAIPKPPVEVKYPCTMDSFAAGYHQQQQQHHHHNHHQVIRQHMDHVQHNHSYHLPVESTSMQRPISRDKSTLHLNSVMSKGGGGGGGGHKSSNSSSSGSMTSLMLITKSEQEEQEHLTRDEKRARQLSVPISVDDIINLPMDEFNERLSKYDLSEAQLSLIRDIRRRGKNKVAAQNCRKRKLDQILSLADEVKDMRDRKIRLLNEHDYLSGECQRVKEKYQQLYRHVFQNLRDPDGNHYSPYQYSLQTSADGSILVVPRTTSTPPTSNSNSSSNETAVGGGVGATGASGGGAKEPRKQQ